MTELAHGSPKPEAIAPRLRYRIGQPILRFAFSTIDRVLQAPLARWYMRRSERVQAFLSGHQIYWPLDLRSRQWGVRLHDERVVSFNDGGNAHIRQLALQYRLLEPEVKQVLANLLALDQRQWLIDGGANIGQMSLAAMTAGRSVLLIEPDPLTAASLRSLCAALPNANSVVHEGALSDTTGRAALRRVANSDMNHLDAYAATGEPDVIAVDIARLDDLLVAHGIQPVEVSVFKLDVEGAEPQALRGSVRLLQEGRPSLLIELLDPVVRVEIALSLQTFGYTAHVIDCLVARQPSLRAIPADQLGALHDCNYCFLQPDIMRQLQQQTDTAARADAMP